ncbi:MAG: STAS domain-containing protein [Calditrichia bacterium]
MDFKSTTREENGITIFNIEESAINHNNAAILKDNLFTEVTAGRNRIILLMGKVKEMDSSGLGAILFGKRQADNAGGGLVLVKVNDTIKTMFRIAQLSRVMDICNTVDEALKLFRQ